MHQVIGNHFKFPCEERHCERKVSLPRTQCSDMAGPSTWTSLELAYQPFGQFVCYCMITRHYWNCVMPNWFSSVIQKFIIDQSAKWYWWLWLMENWKQNPKMFLSFCGHCLLFFIFIVTLVLNFCFNLSFKILCLGTWCF